MTLRNLGPNFFFRSSWSCSGVLGCACPTSLHLQPVEMIVTRADLCNCSQAFICGYPHAPALTVARVAAPSSSIGNSMAITTTCMHGWMGARVMCMLKTSGLLKPASRIQYFAWIAILLGGNDALQGFCEPLKFGCKSSRCRGCLQGKVTEGIHLYEQALACNPQHTDALYNLGVAYAETQQPYRAMFMYEMAIRFTPSCAEAHNNLGVLHRDAGNLERAACCYQAALQVSYAADYGRFNAGTSLSG